MFDKPIPIQQIDQTTESVTLFEQMREPIIRSGHIPRFFIASDRVHCYLARYMVFIVSMSMTDRSRRFGLLDEFPHSFIGLRSDRFPDIVGIKLELPLDRRGEIIDRRLNRHTRPL